MSGDERKNAIWNYNYFGKRYHDVEISYPIPSAPTGIAIKGYYDSAVKKYYILVQADSIKISKKLGLKRYYPKNKKWKVYKTFDFIAGQKSKIFIGDCKGFAIRFAVCDQNPHRQMSDKSKAITVEFSKN